MRYDFTVELSYPNRTNPNNVHVCAVICCAITALFCPGVPAHVTREAPQRAPPPHFRPTAETLALSPPHPRFLIDKAQAPDGASSHPDPAASVQP